MAEFRSARVKEGIAVVSSRFPPRPLSPLAVGVAAAAAVTVGLTAAPGLADQVRDHEWWLTDVHVTQAWQVSRGAGVTVAVLDTGVDPVQPDLSRSVLTGPDYTHSVRHLGDIYWGVRGTAIAVLIAGHGHGPGHGDGIMGIAPKAKILSVRVSLEQTDPLNADAATARGLPTAIASGIRYAVRHGAQVIDLPLDPAAAGANGTPGAAAAAGGAAAERKAVAYALAKGVVLVAPAGDDGSGHGQINYPAAYQSVISVGAFSKGFVRARFSSRHSYVTLTAPGEAVITATSEAGYGTVNSTSAASAEVAGMAALIRSRYPGLTPAQVGHALIQGTRFGRPAGRSNGSGYGTADAQGALSAAAQIETAGQPASPAPPGASPPPVAQAAGAPHQRAALLGDALIGVGALLLLFLLAVIVLMKRRRRPASGTPANGPQPTRPLSARITAPGQATYDDAQSWSPAQVRPRPQLAPVPKLEAGKRSKQPEGPPWEPAPKPDSEPPWGTPDSISNGDGAGGLPHPVGDLNGRSDAIWRASPTPEGPPVQRDPASDPLAGTPVTPGRGAFRVPPALTAGGAPPERRPRSAEPIRPSERRPHHSPLRDPRRLPRSEETGRSGTAGLRVRLPPARFRTRHSRAGLAAAGGQRIANRAPGRSTCGTRVLRQRTSPPCRAADGGRVRTGCRGQYRLRSPHLLVDSPDRSRKERIRRRSPRSPRQRTATATSRMADPTTPRLTTAATQTMTTAASPTMTAVVTPMTTKTTATCDHVLADTSPTGAVLRRGRRGELLLSRGRVDRHVFLAGQLPDRAHHVVGNHTAGLGGRTGCRVPLERQWCSDTHLYRAQAGDRPAWREHMICPHHRDRDHGQA